MTIQQTIKKAGYHPSRIKNVESLFLDSDFWQCLGKAMEWGEVCINCHNSASSCCEEKYNQDWKYFWHNFIDALASGKTAEGFFKELK